MKTQTIHRYFQLKYYLFRILGKMHEYFSIIHEVLTIPIHASKSADEGSCCLRQLSSADGGSWCSRQLSSSNFSERRHFLVTVPSTTCSSSSAVLVACNTVDGCTSITKLLNCKWMEVSNVRRTVPVKQHMNSNSYGTINEVSVLVPAEYNYRLLQAP